MTSAQRPGGTVAAASPGVQAAARLLHHRWGWIWTMVVSLAGFVVAAAAAASSGTGGTASFLLDLVGLLWVIVFVVALAMVFVGTARLRQHAPAVRGPTLAAHRTARRPVLVHPHHHRPHPVVYVFGVLMVAGWIVGGVVMLPRLVDSVGYLAGAAAPRSSLAPTSSSAAATGARP